jgi:SAM-dependent methyltransferase
VAELASRYSREAGGYLETYSPELGPFLRQLLTMARPRDARRILDLGAGPGASVPAIQAAAPEASLVVADRALGMIELAPAEVRRIVADAMNLPFAEASFDVVLMAFVAFHLPDPAGGFAEVARTLTPGGRLAIATWGLDERLGKAWSVWEEELDHAGAPALAPHGLPDHESLGSPELLGAPLRSARFRDPSFETGWWRYRPTHDGFMAFMTKHVVAGRFGELDPERREACVRAVTARTGDLPPEELGLDARVLFAVASR